MACRPTPSTCTTLQLCFLLRRYARVAPYTGAWLLYRALTTYAYLPTGRLRAFVALYLLPTVYRAHCAAAHARLGGDIARWRALLNLPCACLPHRARQFALYAHKTAYTHTHAFWFASMPSILSILFLILWLDLSNLSSSSWFS